MTNHTINESIRVKHIAVIVCFGEPQDQSHNYFLDDYISGLVP